MNILKEYDFPFNTFEDYAENPILKPSLGFQSRAVYNPCVIKVNGRFWMLYRAEGEDNLTGRIGIAESDDGVNFNAYPEPVMVPDREFDRDGCEDPRVVKFDDTYYLIYVGNSQRYHSSNICIATSRDLFYWEKYGPVLKAGEGSWCSGQLKAGVIVPETIDGRYIMYFMGEKEPWVSAIGVAYSDDLFHWEEILQEPVMLPREGFFDSKGIEPGPNPVVMDEVILLIYNGWGEDNVYKPGAVLFSRDHPTMIFKRTNEPVIALTRQYGRESGKPNHCVAEGLIKNNDQWLMYYGAADRLTCVAACKNKEINHAS